MYLLQTVYYHKTIEMSRKNDEKIIKSLHFFMMCFETIAFFVKQPFGYDFAEYQIRTKFQSMNLAYASRAFISPP